MTRWRLPPRRRSPEYLATHPEFFERHPDLVAELWVPHANGHAISLIEHQVGVLRGQLQTERRRCLPS